GGVPVSVTVSIMGDQVPKNPETGQTNVDNRLLLSTGECVVNKCPPVSSHERGGTWKGSNAFAETTTIDQHRITENYLRGRPDLPAQYRRIRRFLFHSR